MPIYEYECEACNAHFERRQRFDEEPIKDCPTCTGRARRVIHSVGVVFKGSGWYTTDYARGANGAPASATDGATKSDSTTPAGSPTDTKSEKKAEKKEEKKAEKKETASAKAESK